jgi:hypothetical protein
MERGKKEFIIYICKWEESFLYCKLMRMKEMTGSDISMSGIARVAAHNPHSEDPGVCEVDRDIFNHILLN